MWLVLFRELRVQPLSLAARGVQQPATALRLKARLAAVPRAILSSEQIQQRYKEMNKQSGP